MKSPRNQLILPDPLCSQTLSLNWINGFKLDRSLAGEWNTLVDLSPTGTVFQRFEWIFEWWRTLSTAGELAILVIRRGTQLLGIMPMHIPAGGRWRYLRMMGESDSDYCNFIFDPEHEAQIWKEAGAEIAAFCKRRKLHGLIATDVPSAHLPGHFKRCGFPVQLIEETPCPYVSLPSTWDEFAARLGKKRTEIPRYFRRLEKNYCVTYRSSHGEALARERAMTSLFELHTRYWQQRGHPGSFPQERHEFHRSVAAGAPKQLRLYEICMDGETRAVFYGYFYKGKTFSYQTGVDPDFPQDRLGTMIFSYAIQKTIEEGGHEFDFARGDEAYKSETWKAQRDRPNAVIAVPASRRSQLAFRLSAADGVPGLGLRDFATMIRARLHG